MFLLSLGDHDPNRREKQEPMKQPSRLDAVGAVVTLLARVADPCERIAAIQAVRAELERYDARFDELTREAILELRAADPPKTWAEIGDMLGVSPQRAYQLADQYLNTRAENRAATQKEPAR